MTRDIATLSAMLAAGLITEAKIREELGDDFLSQVIAYTGGAIAGGLAAEAVDTVIDFFDF